MKFLVLFALVARPALANPAAQACLLPLTQAYQQSLDPRTTAAQYHAQNQAVVFLAEDGAHILATKVQVGGDIYDARLEFRRAAPSDAQRSTKIDPGWTVQLVVFQQGTPILSQPLKNVKKPPIGLGLKMAREQRNEADMKAFEESLDPRDLGLGIRLIGEGAEPGTFEMLSEMVNGRQVLVEFRPAAGGGNKFDMLATIRDQGRETFRKEKKNVDLPFENPSVEKKESQVTINTRLFTDFAEVFGIEPRSFALITAEVARTHGAVKPEDQPALAFALMVLRHDDLIRHVKPGREYFATKSDALIAEHLRGKLVDEPHNGDPPAIRFKLVVQHLNTLRENGYRAEADALAERLVKELKP